MAHKGKTILLFCIFVQGCQKKSIQYQAKEKYRLACSQLTGQRSERDYRQALGFVEEALVCHYAVEYEALKATLLLKLGCADESATSFQHALTQAGDTTIAAEVKNNYACALAQQGDDAQAFEIWHHLVRDPHYVTPEVAWVNMGKWHVDHKDMKKAQHCFIQALNLEPTYVDAHFYAALTGYALGQKSFACDQATTLLALEPEHTGARRLLTMLDNKQVC